MLCSTFNLNIINLLPFPFALYNWVVLFSLSLCCPCFWGFFSLLWLYVVVLTLLVLMIPHFRLIHAVLLIIWYIKAVITRQLWKLCYALIWITLHLFHMFLRTTFVYMYKTNMLYSILKSVIFSTGVVLQIQWLPFFFRWHCSSHVASSWWISNWCIKEKDRNFPC